MSGRPSTGKRQARFAVTAATAFILASLAHHAQAQTVTLDMPVNETIAAGTTVSGAFDLGPDASSGDQSFSLSNFNLTVTGASPENVTSFSATATPYVLYATNEIYNGHSYVFDYYYTRDVSDVDTDGTVDTISVQVGADQRNASDSWMNSAGPYLETGETVTGSPTTGQSFYITNTNIVNQGYYGAVTDALPISSATAISLNQTKNLIYSITGVSGSTNISDISLCFTQTPITSAAPEPAAWLLMIMGVGMIGTTLRRRPRLDSAAA